MGATANPYFRIKGASRMWITSKAVEVDLSRERMYWAVADRVGGVYAATYKFQSRNGGRAWAGDVWFHNELSRTLERDVSHDAFRHLAGRIDVGAAEFYQDFRRAEQRLRGRPLRRMSALTEAILGSIDYAGAKQQRERNFLFLHAALGASNLLRIDVAEVDGPMVYPYLSDDATLRQRLLARRIYVATYWDDVLQRDSASALEKSLAARLVPLPIDQRYGTAEMQVIVETVRGSSCSGEP
jgi:hypothetical protein